MVSDGFCIDNKEEGVSKWYYESGALNREVPFKNGLNEGVGKSYYENGQLAVERGWRNGKEEGLWKCFDEYGNEITRT